MCPKDYIIIFSPTSRFEAFVSLDSYQKPAKL